MCVVYSLSRLLYSEARSETDAHTRLFGAMSVVRIKLLIRDLGLDQLGSLWVIQESTQAKGGEDDTR